MGRGRQKAKHTKVARELKYFSPDTNYNALERELTHPVTGAPIDPKLEEDLEKWPEFSASSHAPDVSEFSAAEYSAAEYGAAEYDVDEYDSDRYETDQNKTA